MRIMVGIPAREGRITAAMAMFLMGEYAPDIEFEICISQLGGVHFARDEIAKNFLDSDADRLVYLDDDVSGDPGSLIQIARHDVDLCGGAYRLKQDTEEYPVRWREGAANPVNGLIEVNGLPGGFMSVSRNVFEKMRAAHPERKYSTWGTDYHGFFCMPYGGGEDYRFCADWRALGGKVWLDPDLNLTHHAGSKSYPGNVGNWLRSQNKKAA